MLPRYTRPPGPPQRAAVCCAGRTLRKAPVRVTLVDRRVYNTFQPLLYQVATGGLNPGVVREGLAVEQAHGAGVVVDLHQVLVHDVEVALTDPKENSFAVYSRSQAIAIRDALFTRLERAAVRPERHSGSRCAARG
jgi:NADH dehydrogenase